VEDVDGLFDKLLTLQANNWLVVTEEQPQAKKITKVGTGGPPLQ